MTLKEQIEAYNKMFVTSKREDATTFVHTTEDASEDLKEAIREAHGHRFPDDWVYGTFADLLSSLNDYEIESIDNIEDCRHEIVDSYVDIYTASLTAWLASDIRNVYYLTEVLEQFEPKDGFQLLAMAQYQAIDEVFSSIVSLLEKTQ